MNDRVDTELSPLDAISLWLFCALAAISALYRLQFYSAFPFSSGFRLGLYVVLGGIVLGLRRQFLSVPQIFWLVGGTLACVGIHTYYISDAILAIHATSRFGNVLMLAPIAAVLLVCSRQLEKVFWIVLLVFLCAAGSLLFQFFGGKLDRLIQGYIAIRGDLVRYMTIVGEPNVGGMLASLVFALSIAMPWRRTASLLWGGLSVMLVVFSLSKAAMLGMGLGFVSACVLFDSKGRSEVVFRTAGVGLVGIALLWSLGAEDYLRVGLDSILGGIRGEPSAFQDLQYRQSSIDLDAILAASAFPRWLAYLLGGSFFNVGSAAQEIRGLEAGVVLPHNSYLELFLTGGGLMLGLVLFLMARASFRLLRSQATESWPIDRCALICLVMLSAWMFVYPVIYEPVTGCFFWIIVGYGNRQNSHEK